MVSTYYTQVFQILIVGFICYIKMARRTELSGLPEVGAFSGN